MENIIFSSAHPDDITGSAGTMLRLKNRHKIHMVDMTRGESGMLREKVSFDECAAIRTAEEEAVAKMLNADLHFLGEKDIFGEGFAGREVCERAAKLIEELKPRAIFLNWPLDVHIDHVMSNAIIFKALDIATKRSGYDTELYFHEHTVQTKGFNPDCFADITDVFEERNKLIRLYKCQNRNDFLVTCKTLDARFRGSRCNVMYAEAFVAFYPEKLRTRPTIFDELAAEKRG